MNIADLENIKGVKLSKVSQIGIMVPDIGKAVSYYSKFLNIRPWFRSNTASNETAFKGGAFPLELDIARLTGDIDLIPPPGYWPAVTSWKQMNSKR